MAQFDEDAQVLRKQRRERRMKRGLSLTSWGIAVVSVGGLFGIYHKVAAMPLKKLPASPTTQVHNTAEKPTADPAKTISAHTTVVADSVLQLGSQSDSVRNLQQNLGKLGFYTLGYFTDYFGPTTERAVRRFQHRYGLPVTGVADAATTAKIHSLASAPAVSSQAEQPKARAPQPQAQAAQQPVVVTRAS